MCSKEYAATCSWNGWRKLSGDKLGLSPEVFMAILDPGKCNEGTSLVTVLMAREPDEGGEGRPVRIEDTGGSSMRGECVS